MPQADEDLLIKRFLGMRAQVMGMLRMLVPCDLVDDAYQEACLAVIRGLDAYDRERPFEPWARGVVRNIARRTLRLRGRELSWDPDILAEQLEQCLEDHGEEAELAVQHLRTCLESVETRQRTLLSLRYADGHSMQEIAERVQRSAGSVQVALSRIRQFLAQCIQQRRSQA